MKAIKIRCKETQEEFPSMAAAARSVGKSRQAIFIAIKEGGKCGGYHWEKLDSDEKI